MKFLYLHGFASGPHSSKARFFVRRFAELGHELQVPQLDEGDFENLTLTGQLRVLEQAAGGQDVSLMGSSMGGYLAALYASRHPETARLVLMAPAFFFPERWPESLGRKRMEEWRERGRMNVFHYGEMRERPISYKFVENARGYDPAPSFSQPALLFHGTHDEVVPAGYSEEFAAQHPNVILRLLDSDHQLTDQVDRMWEEVRSFLQLPG